MTLANIDFGELNSKVGNAVEHELPLINELRKEVRQLKVKKLGERPCRSIAPVATDGGENRLSFEPLNLEIIRVVDSNGTDLVQEVIPLSQESDVFLSYVDKIPPLKKMLEMMNGISFNDISFLIGRRRNDKSEGSERVPDIRGQLRAFRDIVEWAVLLDLASRDWPTDVLLLRDGLLRTKILKLTTFPLLDDAFRRVFEKQGTESKHRVYLLGVAKTSAVLSKISLALMLEGTFQKDYPCYAEVPKTLEARCYNFDRTWLDTAEDRGDTTQRRYQSFGRLHLVKLSSKRESPIFPVDVPIWLPVRDRQTILEYLVHDSNATFPIVGYPNSLQKAHEFAVMTGLEMSVLGDMMISKLLNNTPDELKEKVLRHVNLGRGLIKGGSRYGG